MAWNKPNKNAAGRYVNVDATSSSRHWWHIAGAVAILGAGIAAWWLWPEGETRQDAASTAENPALIKEVTPSAAPTNAPVEKKYSEMTTDEKLKYWKDMYGDNPPENVKPIIYYLENPPQRHFKAKESKYKIFAHSSERHIAALLSVRPGNWLMRPPLYDEQFDLDFAASMADKIEIGPDDTDEQRALKEAVIATKKEFAERAKQGENPSDIMNQAGKELFELGQFKRDLELEIGKVRRDPNASDEDYSTLVEAANKMLESKGLPPMRQPSIFERQCALRCQAERNRKNRLKKGNE